MAIHVAPVVLHLRGYEHAEDVDKPLYQMKKPYDYHCIMIINDLGIARVAGLVGTMPIKDYRDLFKIAKNNGAWRMDYRHKEKEIQKDLTHIKA